MGDTLVKLLFDSFLLVFCIFLLIVAGRHLPVADAMYQSFKIPAAMVPPIVPHALVVVASTFMLWFGFKTNLGGGG